MVSGFNIAKLSYDLPLAINPSAEYIFFLHGKIVETYGPNGTHSSFGIYDYHGIVKAFESRGFKVISDVSVCKLLISLYAKLPKSSFKAFESRGFKVISDVRPKGTKLYKYAEKIVRQIKTLLAYGLPPEQITVVGFSKGSAITLLVSTKLKISGVNFVLMSGCSHKGTHVRRRYKKLIDRSVQFMQGRFLSIQDESDPKCDICQRILKNTSNETTFNEIKVKNGLGHSLFYRPRRDWLEPIVEWIDQK